MPLNLALVHELAGNASAHGKTYCYPSQDTLVAGLRRHHGQAISRRTLNRHLAALEAAGWIKRVCRHQNKQGIGWAFRSTLYVLLGPVWRLVRRITKAVQLAAGWSRVTKVANNLTPSGLRSSAGAPAAPPATAKRSPPAGAVDILRAVLHKK